MYRSWLGYRFQVSYASVQFARLGTNYYFHQGSCMNAIVYLHRGHGSSCSRMTTIGRLPHTIHSLIVGIPFPYSLLPPQAKLASMLQQQGASYATMQLSVIVLWSAILLHNVGASFHQPCASNSSNQLAWWWNAPHKSIRSSLLAFGPPMVLVIQQPRSLTPPPIHGPSPPIRPQISPSTHQASSAMASSTGVATSPTA